MKFVCTCGKAFDHLGRFCDHRVMAHGTDACRAPGTKRAARRPGPPCVICGNPYGAYAEGDDFPIRSPQGRCLECWDRYQDRVKRKQLTAETVAKRRHAAFVRKQ